MTPEAVLSHQPRARSARASASRTSARATSSSNRCSAPASWQPSGPWSTNLSSGASRRPAPARSSIWRPATPLTHRGCAASARPHQHHPLFWEITSGVLADVAADLVGPDVVFHHSKLNFKWNDGHDQVDWHQDIQFYPHTNYSPLTIGLLLEDMTLANGSAGLHPGKSCR